MITYSLRLRAGSISLVGQALGVGAGVMYATIEAGRVTAVNFGPLPSSTDTVLYFDLTGYAIPAVDDYFSDVCQTFSSLPPVIPAGDLAPPYTPGGTPPDPDSPDYPNPELPPVDDKEPLANTAPVFLSFHADGTDSVTVTGTGALSEVSPLMRSIVRIQDICAVRLHAMVDTPDAGLELVLCFSVDEGTTWEELSPGKTGPAVTLAAAGAVVGAYVNVDPAVSGDTLLGICVTGTGSAVVGNIFATLFAKTSSGSCLEFSEGVPVCPLNIDTFWTDDGTVQVWDNAVLLQESAAEFYAGFPYGAEIFTGLMGWRDPEDSASYFDPDDPRGPCAVMVHNDGGTEQNLYWVHNLGNTTGSLVTLTTTLIDPALVEQTGSVVGTDTQGLIPMYATTSAGTFKVHLQAGRVWVSRNNADPQDVGDATLLVGTPKEIVCEVVPYNISGTPYVKIAVYASDICTVGERELIGERIYSGIGGIAMTIDQVYCWEWLSQEESGEQRVWQIALGRVNAASIERLP